MITRKICLLSLTAFCLLFGSAANAAEQGSVNVMIPWEGEGRVFNVAPTTMMFLGAIEGIMYIESSQGDMHEAFIICPIMQELDLESGDTNALGRCEITASPESVAYASLSCKGRVGVCEGDFTLVGGEGTLAGISGSGKLRVRSPIRALAGDLGTGALLRVASGLAVIDELQFKIP
jgi:hypothetical protein